MARTSLRHRGVSKSAQHPCILKQRYLRLLGHSREKKGQLYPQICPEWGDLLCFRDVPKRDTLGLLHCKALNKGTVFHLDCAYAHCGWQSCRTTYSWLLDCPPSGYWNTHTLFPSKDKQRHEKLGHPHLYLEIKMQN